LAVHNVVDLFQLCAENVLSSPGMPTTGSSNTLTSTSMTKILMLPTLMNWLVLRLAGKIHEL